MLEISDDSSMHVEMGEIGFFEDGIQRLTAEGIGPCFVFVAFYQRRPLAVYYWGGPSSDNTLPLAKLIGLELDKFRFKITEKRSVLQLPDFEEDYPDGDQPIDILPIGGQISSQAIVNAMLGMRQKAKHRILSTDYLNLTFDMDFLDLEVIAQGLGEAAIILRHIPSHEYSVLADEDNIQMENDLAEFSIAAAPALFAPQFEAVVDVDSQFQFWGEIPEPESPNAIKKPGLS